MPSERIPWHRKELQDAMHQPIPNITECADCYHLWHVDGYCARCGKKREDEHAE